MTWGQLVRSALEAIQWNRLRSLLTVLGIVIGIAAVMVTVGLGEGAQAKVSSKIAALGSNLLTVAPGSTSAGPGVRRGLGSASTLTMADAAALSSRVVAPAVAAVAPLASQRETLTNGAIDWPTTVDGTTPSWLTIRSRSVEVGRFISTQDEVSNADVVVLGALTAQELFSSANPIGRVVDVGPLPMTVIGVLAPVGSGTSATSNQDDLAIVPISTAQGSLFGTSANDSVQSILLQATSSSTLSAAYQEADHELMMLHGATNPANADFTITAEQSLFSAATSISATLTALLAGIATVSLLVGGIGVMNIMLVSVTERTREIGLRKALGAKPSDIRRQFLVEASVLGVSGGLVGAALGLLGQLVLPSVISNPVIIPPIVTVAAVAVALMISLLFGVYPAARAAQLSPIDALRSE
ncbi:ABC transporter permease [Ferrimicrobium sp.]|uniref:ABC transporter permease n=1 Tax=Ferrimicrobium sp. TaxID=2926050 RepID=UPI0026020857|nr:ABC transporter permease [Ferrimicrobium sp.]